ncbi:unnamed protein product [Ilex paraguariensis]|uniref:Uncharacterized protein n=1 Tax=Ilex paraguariensis TaxID=185542 RepID=A0ABC8UIL3_9AQUA
MDPPKPSQPQPPPPPQLHQSDADEDDETVKQLKECSSVYLALQDCLVKTDRSWKSCQKVVVLDISIFEVQFWHEQAEFVFSMDILFVCIFSLKSVAQVSWPEYGTYHIGLFNILSGLIGKSWRGLILGEQPNPE